MTQHALRLQRIEPISTEVVTVAFSVRLPRYGQAYTSTSIELFGKLLKGGTQDKTREELEAYLHRHGIMLSIQPRRGILEFMVTSRQEAIGAVVSLLESLIYSPLLSIEDIRSEKTLLREQIREAYDDTELLADIAFTNHIYPATSTQHRLTLPEQESALKEATRKTLTQIKDDLHKGEWYISIVGVEAAVAAYMPLIEKLAKNAATLEHTPETLTIKSSRNTYITVRGKTNIELRIGNALPITQLDDDYIQVVFGLAVLGNPGGFSGRLMSTVREKEGLTYRIYATTEHAYVTNPGHWYIYTFFTARDIKSGIAATRRELLHLVEKGITKNELRTFKEILETQYLIAHESNTRRLRLYHRNYVEGKTETQLTQDLEKIKSLTAPAVHGALQRYIQPKRLIITGAGPVNPRGQGILS